MIDPVQRLKGGLIASCQPVNDGPMDYPDTVGAMAAAAVAGGAAGIRIEGVENVRAARPRINVPIIGIVKANLSETDARITVCTKDVDDLVEAGADIVAFDATDRPRTDDRFIVLQHILSNGVKAMADCSCLDDGIWAFENGADILGTTLSGYTVATKRPSSAPDFELIKRLRNLSAFVMAEGRFDTPELAARAISAGADAVTVGSVLTRLEVVTNRFACAIQSAVKPELSGFALDIGGTKTAVAKITDGQVTGYLQKPTNRNADPEEQISALSEMLKEIGYTKGEPIGAGVTGRVDENGQWHAVNVDTMKRVADFSLSDRLSAEFGPSTVINDAAAATIAEHVLGTGKHHNNFAYITVSTGVGGGLILNGKLHQSPSGKAGHLGFASTRRGIDVCGSGRRGTIESIAGGNAIAAAAMSTTGTECDAKDVFRLASMDVKWADDIVEKSAEAIAELSADLVTMLGITKIAIGGSIGLADGYLSRVALHLAAHPSFFHCEIVPASLGANGPLIGALINTLEEIRS